MMDSEFEIFIVTDVAIAVRIYLFEDIIRCNFVDWKLEKSEGPIQER